MKVSVSKSDISGSIKAPSSKSMTIRALMCAALAKGESEIINPLVSDDTNAAADVLSQIGVDIRKEDNIWRVTGGSLRSSSDDLYCGESATTLRFMTAICSLIPGEHRLVGGSSLTKRPVRSLVEALKKLGIKAATEGKTTPPVTITGGKLKGSLTELPGNVSSQFVSALLLVAPFAEKELNIKLTTPLTSRPYVLMTLRCMRQFGVNVSTEFDRFVIRRQRYTPTRFEVEGDWSSASYYLALGAISDGVTVENLRSSSLQGDRVMLDFLRSMGVTVTTTGNSVTVSKGSLRAIQADFSDCIDLLPTMAVLAALADGKSDFSGIERARIKESNRINAVKAGLGKMEKMGITAIENQDRLSITGMMTEDASRKSEDEEEETGDESTEEQTAPEELGETIVDSYNDHRIAMAFGVFGAAVGNITIEGAECVAKTFPEFWDKLKSVGGVLKIDAE